MRFDVPGAVAAGWIGVALLAGGCAGSDDAGSAVQINDLPTPAAPGSLAPHLAVASSGAVVMSWLEPAGEGRHALRFATLAGDRWSPPRTVAEGSDWFINWADFPSVTPITDRDWVAHWLVRQPGGTYSYDIAIAISRDAGASWGAAVTPHDDGTPTEHGFVTLFPWEDGFGAVWLDGRNTRPAPAGGATLAQPAGMTVRYARLGFDGTRHADGEIDSLVCDCCATDVALATAGPVVTYRNRTGDEVRDIAVSRFADGSWQPPLILGNDQWVVPGCPVNGSAIAAQGERVVVAWYTAPGRQPRVQLAWSADGGRSFAPPVMVEETGASGRVDVVLPDPGLAVVSWTAKTADGVGQIRRRRMPIGGEPGPVQLIAEGDVSRNAGFPQMIAGRDRLVYAWTEPGEPSRLRTAWSALR